MGKKISIIVATLNDAKDIEDLLKSVKNQAFRDYEILVVDGGSTDGTIEIAKKYTKNVFVLPKAGVAKSKNYAIKKARGELIQFFDADNFISDRNYLKKVHSIFMKNDIDALAVKISPAKSGNMLVRAQAAYRKTRWEHHQKDNVFDVDPKNITFSVFRHDFVRKIGGFNEKMVGNDDIYMAAMTKKLNAKTLFDPCIEVYHKDPYDFGQIKRQALWYGRVTTQDPLARQIKRLGYLGVYIALYALSLLFLMSQQWLWFVAINVPFILAGLYVFSRSLDLAGGLYLIYVLNPYRAFYFYLGYLRSA